MPAQRNTLCRLFWHMGKKEKQKKDKKKKMSILRQSDGNSIFLDCGKVL